MREFGIDRVVDDTFRVYGEVLSGKREKMGEVLSGAERKC